MNCTCLILFLMSLASTVLACSQPTAHYTTLGCVPSDEKDEDGCPVSYACPSCDDRQPDKCYLQGKEYSVGKKIPQTHSDCTFLECSQLNENETKIMVAIMDCARPIDSENCVQQFKHGQCCLSGRVCGEARNSLATCNVLNTVYYEGERVPLPDSCDSCICGPCGNPVCKPRMCDFEFNGYNPLLYGAAPVYREDSCCPVNFREQASSDVVLQGVGVRDEELQCTYGNLTLYVGDYLSPVRADDGFYICICAIPPLVYCIVEQRPINENSPTMAEIFRG